jgi:tetratricopeptide (TPR) repeat protein
MLHAKWACIAKSMKRDRDLLANSCPQCGEPLIADGKSCAKCGGQRRGPTSWFVAIFAASLLIGMASTAVFWLGGLEHGQARPASAMAAAVPKRGQVRSAPMMVTGGLPPDHPSVMSLNGGTISFVAKAEEIAEANPKDVKAWDLFGDVALAATAFDLSYYEKAEQAYGHALKIDPNDPSALKGMGNVDYDRRRYDAAISAYERYLRAKPDDPKVLTDLGTMYMTKKHVSEALKLYGKALAIEPDLFAARFNSAVAYLLRNDKTRADAELKEARKVAPDASGRMRLDEMIAKLEGRSAPSTLNTVATVDKPPATFHGAIERVVRTLPFEGRKVESIEWPSKLKAVVVIKDRAMGRMEAANKARLLADLRSGIVTAKVAHHVSGTVEVEIEDARTNRTMAAVTD